MLRFVPHRSLLRATLGLLVLVGLLGVGGLAPEGVAPLGLLRSRAHAQDEERARALFQEGNRHLALGLRARGARREVELESALSSFQECLGIVRSRNVLFNAALAFAALERHMEAYNFFAEYLRIEDLSAEERQEAERRLGELAGRVAVLDVRSDPSGAELRVDRSDLPARGRTPLRVAVPEGRHRVILRHEGYEEASGEAEVGIGGVSPVELTLRPRTISLQVLAPADGELRLDGERIEPGQLLPVVPGSHRVTLHMEGRQPAERRFTIEPGAAPLIFELAAPPPLPPPAALPLAFRSEVPATLLVDGIERGSGAELEVELSTEREHLARVEAEGYWPFELELSLPATQPGTGLPASGRRLTVDLAPIEVSGGILGLRAASLTLTTLSALAAAITFGAGMDVRDGYLQSPSTEELELGNALLLSTDLLLAGTALFGTFTLISLTFDDRAGGPSQGTLSLVPAPGGGIASLEGSFL